MFFAEASLALNIEADPGKVTAGYFKLDWQAEENDTLVLQRTTSPSFVEIQSIQVNDVNSITLTGYDDGTYFFRLMTSSGKASNTVRVEVEHHSMRKALLFFFTGLILFLILLFVLWNGHQQSDKAVVE